MAQSGVEFKFWLLNTKLRVKKLKCLRGHTVLKSIKGVFTFANFATKTLAIIAGMYTQMFFKTIFSWKSGHTSINDANETVTLQMHCLFVTPPIVSRIEAFFTVRTFVWFDGRQRMRSCDVILQWIENFILSCDSAMNWKFYLIMWFCKKFEV